MLSENFEARGIWRRVDRIFHCIALGGFNNPGSRMGNVHVCRSARGNSTCKTICAYRGNDLYSDDTARFIDCPKKTICNCVYPAFWHISDNKVWDRAYSLSAAGVGMQIDLCEFPVRDIDVVCTQRTAGVDRSGI